MSSQAEDHDSENQWQEPKGLVRAALQGIAIGVVVAMVGVTLAALANGQKLGAALGLGGFAAVWTGLGFGFMTAGVTFAQRLEDSEGHH